MHHWYDVSKGEGDACSVSQRQLDHCLMFPKTGTLGSGSLVFFLICSLILQLVVWSIRDRKQKALLKLAQLNQPCFSLQLPVDVQTTVKIQLSYIRNICATCFGNGKTQVTTASIVAKFFGLNSEPGINGWDTVRWNGSDRNIIIVNNSGIGRGAHYGKKNEYNFRGKNHNFLFHATTREYALNILTGIRVERGGEQRDFSHNDGFYLNNDFDDALRFKMGEKNRAVVVYRHERDALNKFPGLDLTGDENEEMWENVVNFFRSDEDDEIPKPAVLENNPGWIEGPMAQKRATRRAPEGERVQRPRSYQLCVKSDEVAKHFDGNIHSIIFLDGQANVW